MKWQDTQWNAAVTLKPKLLGQFKFVVPELPGHVNLISRPWTPVKAMDQIKIRYRITGPGYFKSLDLSQGQPPNFRPMLQVAGDNWRTPDNRWWPVGNNYALLTSSPDIKTYKFFIFPGEWSNVDGEMDKGAFQRFLARVGSVSLAFGGGNSFSHGVLAVGAIKFELLGFDIS